MRRIFIAIVLTIAVPAVRGNAVQTQTSGAPAWAAMVAEFLAEPRRVAAPTPQYFLDELEHTNAMLARVQAIDPSSLSRADAIDRRLMEAMLVGRVVEQERIRRWRFDPLVYMPSTRALLAIFDDDMVFEDPASHADAVLAALRAMPAELKNGQANLTLYVASFRAQATVVTAAASAIFESDLPALIEMLPAENPSLSAAADYTRQSMLEWSAFLKTYLPKRQEGFYAIGMPAYDALLEGRELTGYNSNGLYRFSQAAFDRTIDELEAAAQEIDPEQSWLEILQAEPEETSDDPPAARPTPEPPAVLSTPEPPKAPALIVYHDAIDAARARLEAKDLPRPTWKNRIDVVPRPTVRNDTLYYPTSAGAMSTDADGTMVSRWLINPNDPSAKEFLGPDGGAVRSSTAYGAWADHLLGLYQLHNASALRQAVRSPMTVEGWTVYNEQAAADAEASRNDTAHLRRLQLTLWRIARVVVDVGLHTNKLTEEEATTLLTKRVGLPAASAAMEIAEAANAPTAHLGYMGFVELRRIRDDLEKERGASFSLIDFHKRLLEAGPLPPALLRASLIDVR